jgi:hypothetical protein
MKSEQGFSFAWEAGFSRIFFPGLSARSPPRPLMPFAIAEAVPAVLLARLK